MAKTKRAVIGGVDTHGLTHHAAVIDEQGRLLDDAQFTADTAGYRQLAAWLRRHGDVLKVGVEGTGSYGAGLATFLLEQGVTVLEVDRPDRRTRRRRGKSDAIDAEAAARAALSGTATALPRGRHGVIESIRALRIARSGAVKARTAAINSLKSLLVTAPAALRESLAGKGSSALVAACARLRAGDDLSDATTGVKAALVAVARRVTQLDAEIAASDARLGQLLAAAAPTTMALKGIGPDHAGQLLATAGANPERLRGEAAFAHLCGVAPIPASSGKTNRHRLHRGGDRDANRALHLAVVVRMRYCQRTRAYVTRRTTDGLAKPDIMRCLKRYLAREVYHAIKADFEALHRA
ncbi:IS110 family transposase [Catellatospora sp. NPDC049609]|uniref:IS110 family transposase n=1 Tax=Catellatospora sp. NPDC049609 TaxID=3155505 RepID=UPI003448E7CD